MKDIIWFLEFCVQSIWCFIVGSTSLYLCLHYGINGIVKILVGFFGMLTVLVRGWPSK